MYLDAQLAAELRLRQMAVNVLPEA